MTLATDTAVRVHGWIIEELVHVNNARFRDQFERRRHGWYNRCDSTLLDTATGVLGKVVVNVDIDYQRECFAGGRLTVLTRAPSRGRESYVLRSEESS